MCGSSAWSMSFQLSLFILGVLLVVGWFALGTHLNVRRGEAALRWLQDGLPLAGEKTTLRWLGSSAVELKLQPAKAPFHEAAVLVLLEPRDVPLLWWLFRWRGRRDLFIFRASLNRHPHRELEALNLAAWSVRSVRRRVQAEGWQPVPAPPPLTAYAPQPVDASNLIQAATLDGCLPVRLSVRRAEPNLEVQWLLAELSKLPARSVFETLRRLAGQL
jgi:hypothetical protein